MPLGGQHPDESTGGCDRTIPGVTATRGVLLKRAAAENAGFSPER